MSEKRHDAVFIFFFNDTATTEIYTLSLHDALPISAIPPKRTDAPVACPDWIHADRRFVENLWARLKEWRAVATRYEKTARSFLGVLCIATTADWLKVARLCIGPGFLGNPFHYAARLRVWSCQVTRMSLGLRWPFFSISHSAL